MQGGCETKLFDRQRRFEAFLCEQELQGKGHRSGPRWGHPVRRRARHYSASFDALEVTHLRLLTTTTNVGGSTSR